MNEQVTYIAIPLNLVHRLCRAFLEMQEQGARCTDFNLMEDLDLALERTTPVKKVI